MSVCARCGDAASATHRCRTWSPARAAVAVAGRLPADATLEDLDARLVGSPCERARVLAALPPWRRERLWEQLALDADRAHEAEAA